MNALASTPWRDLLRSIGARRSHDARFFKPVCLIGVVDLVSEGAIEPENIQAARAIERFRAVVHDLFPDRAGLGWRPLWHLSHDGAWVFTEGGRRVVPEDFGDARKPDSAGQFYSRFDHIAVPETMLEHWRSASARSSLREAALAMLAADDGDSRTFAVALGDPASKPPGPSTPVRPNGGGQGFQSDPKVRRAVERRAMTIAQSWLEKEGWTVLDRSGTEPYDFEAYRNAQTRYVEVKGTTGPGDTINITQREVQFARANRMSMILVVVSGIDVEVSEDQISASGGQLDVWHEWAPEPTDLRPVSFICTVRERE